jgi:predicted nucleic acid-binding protein
MAAVADAGLKQAGTAWHCCLEFYSVSTRLPAEYRLTPSDAERLLMEEVIARLEVADLPPADRAAFVSASARDSVAGGRIYDAHIAEVARAAGAEIIVTDNRRHFLAALRHGLKVQLPSEFLAERGKQRDR